jgi:PST family polysaccharide transporter
VPLATAILALTLIPKTLTLSAEAQLNNRQRLHRLVRPQLIGTLAFLTAAVLISAHYRTAWAMSLATVIQVCVYSAALLWLVRHEVTLRWRFRQVLSSLWSARDFIALALVGVLVAQVDGLIVGGIAGPTEAGYYIMAAWLISRVPSFAEIPLLRALLPVFAALKGDAPRLADLFKRSAMGINYVEAPWAFLLMFNATLVTQLVLGPRWTPAVPLVTLIAAYPLLSPLGTVGWEVLRMTGRTRMVLGVVLVSSLIFVGGGIGLGLRTGVIGVIIAYYVATLINNVVIVALPTLIGWAKVREVLLGVALLYAACAGPLLVVGTLPLTPVIKFSIDSVLMAGVAIIGLRPLLPVVRNALAGRLRDAGTTPVEAPVRVEEASA